MSCILSIGGKNFAVDEFIEKTRLKPYKKSYKGQPRFKTKPDGEKLPYSFISMEASNADFEDLNKQITDAIRFLKRNKEKLAQISATKGIEFSVLDFGIYLRIDKKKVLCQSDTFPNKLLKLAVDLGLDIELSIYPVDLQTILEKRHSNSKKKG
jgi:hypothetical protein